MGATRAPRAPRAQNGRVEMIKCQRPVAPFKNKCVLDNMSLASFREVKHLTCTQEEKNCMQHMQEPGAQGCPGASFCAVLPSSLQGRGRLY